MASAADPQTVWVGFMDFVPVIGTMKEMVEWVLALYEGNKEVVLEKESTILHFVQGPLDQHLKIIDKPLEKKPRVEPEEARAGPSRSALLDIKEIQQDELLNFLSCPKGAKKKPANISKKDDTERNKKIEEVKKNILKMILPVKPDYRLVEPLKEELNRSKRGEHVFNINILKFHAKVLKDFFIDNGISSHGRYTEKQFTTLGSNTLDANTRKEIQTSMTVDFDEHEFYVNANSTVYGVYCEELRKGFHKILNCRDLNTIPDDLKNKLEFIIDNMNNFEIYVDHFAKEKWIGNHDANSMRFDFVKGRVVNMYQNERSWKWITDVWGQLKPLYDQ